VLFIHLDLLAIGVAMLVIHPFLLGIARTMLDHRPAMPNTAQGLPFDPSAYDENRTYTAKQLAAAANVSQHIIRHYVRGGVLPRAEPKGPNTRFTEDHRMHLLAIAELRKRGMNLSQVRQELANASTDDIIGIAGYVLDPAKPAPVPAPTTTAAPAAAVGMYRAHAARSRRTWESLALCPGVFLIVLAEADSEARRVAREIETTYCGQT
jgi:DNA-binding transcriptional MerR regulator